MNEDLVSAAAPASCDVEVSRRPALSVVVIGRNEEIHLGKAFESLRAISLDYEVIYVDSDSEDRSVEIAVDHRIRVARLLPSPNLSAAAGRFVGTLLARGDWILYLDGDMELAPEFAERIPELLKAAEGSMGIAGYVGLYENRHPDGTVRFNLLRQRPGRLEADTFGGAVLALRAAVLAAGNWNPRISAYEELDLHSRLAGTGDAIHFVPIRMVTHHTDSPRMLPILLNLFLPFGRRNRRALGIGQVFRARVQERMFGQFLRFYPYPFAYLLLLAAGIAVAVLPFQGALAGLALVAVGAVYVARARGGPSIVVYLSFPLRILLGAISYPSHWEPSYEIVDVFRGTEGAEETAVIVARQGHPQGDTGGTRRSTGQS